MYMPHTIVIPASKTPDEFLTKLESILSNVIEVYKISVENHKGPVDVDKLKFSFSASSGGNVEFTLEDQF